MSPNADRPSGLLRLRAALLDDDTRHRLLAVLVAALACLAAFVGFGAVSGAAGMGGFEAGKVADRDIVAERDVTYVDAKATKIRTDAERRLVPAVFSIDDAATRSAMESLVAFRKAFVQIAASTKSADELALKLRGKFPDLSNSTIIPRLLEYPVPGTAIEQGRIALDVLMQHGIFSFPDTGLEQYNPEAVELRRWTDGPLVYEQVPIEKATTMRRIRTAAADTTKALKLSASMSAAVIDIVSSFARENAFFDAEQSARRLDAALARIEPVMRRIAKGEHVIRRGFIVTSEDIERLAALRGSGIRISGLYVLGGAILILLVGLGSGALFGKANTGVRLEWTSFLFVLLLGSGYFIVSSMLMALLPASLSPQLQAFLPSALISMVVAIVIGERFAVLFAMVTSLGLLLITGFNTLVPAEAFLSGIAGIILVRRAEKRIDLVRAGAQLALVCFISGAALAALADRGLLGALGVGFWSSINGFMSGVLALAFLPVLEQALNAPTVFRLQELSDLNAPALKRLLSVAPGTYSHSVTVAHLAESACREIGADALLARVGAYYHDIGKIDKPEYFIENQSGYNKHDEINPRLSATVLRGHVKFGLERAEALRLPDAVKAIIAEHHGTSLISYFFAQAKREASETNSEDYRYPGPVPSSREAAVVMLADCVEAASRTLKRPTIGRLEQFVKEIVMDRYENGQLAMSELTFRDLEIIKNTFVRVLSGHFHSRIEYPRTREQT
jgi:putative nucleotidyltransferase with HDIG domain